MKTRQIRLKPFCWPSAAAISQADLPILKSVMSPKGAAKLSPATLTFKLRTRLDQIFDFGEKGDFSHLPEGEKVILKKTLHEVSIQVTSTDSKSEPFHCVIFGYLAVSENYHISVKIEWRCDGKTAINKFSFHGPVVRKVKPSSPQT